mmetsp:Transcript_17792/g.41058  ORF Transcript_17792/g.41058 Transcript_17792/m.41058 type:complete len:84 (-) Transcript_17792:40-291(-)
MRISIVIVAVAVLFKSVQFKVDDVLPAHHQNTQKYVPSERLLKINAKQEIPILFSDEQEPRMSKNVRLFRIKPNLIFIYQIQN